MFEEGKSSKRSLDKTKDDTKNKIYSEGTYRTYKNNLATLQTGLRKNTQEALTIDDA